MGRRFYFPLDIFTANKSNYELCNYEEQEIVGLFQCNFWVGQVAREEFQLIEPNGIEELILIQSQFKFVLYYELFREFSNLFQTALAGDCSSRHLKYDDSCHQRGRRFDFNQFIWKQLLRSREMKQQRPFSGLLN